jgi:hypothetical protein
MATSVVTMKLTQLHLFVILFFPLRFLKSSKKVTFPCIVICSQVFLCKIYEKFWFCVDPRAPLNFYSSKISIIECASLAQKRNAFNTFHYSCLFHIWDNVREKSPTPTLRADRSGLNRGVDGQCHAVKMHLPPTMSTSSQWSRGMRTRPWPR